MVPRNPAKLSALAAPLACMCMCRSSPGCLNPGGRWWCRAKSTCGSWGDTNACCCPHETQGRKQQGSSKVTGCIKQELPPVHRAGSTRWQCTVLAVHAIILINLSHAKLSFLDRIQRFSMRAPSNAFSGINGHAQAAESERHGAIIGRGAWQLNLGDDRCRRAECLLPDLMQRARIVPCLPVRSLPHTAGLHAAALPCAGAGRRWAAREPHRHRCAPRMHPCMQGREGGMLLLAPGAVAHVHGAWRDTFAAEFGKRAHNACMSPVQLKQQVLSVAVGWQLHAR